MNNTARCPKITVSADGQGIVFQGGGVLLVQTLRLTGLDRGLSAALGRWRAPRAVHDPGKIIADLAAALAMGGDCLADVAMLRAQPLLFGPVASDPVVSRLISALAAGAPRGHGPARPPPRSPASRPSHPADQPRPSLQQRKETLGPVEPRPPGATAGPAR